MAFTNSYEASSKQRVARDALSGLALIFDIGEPAIPGAIREMIKATVEGHHPNYRPCAARKFIQGKLTGDAGNPFKGSVDPLAARTEMILRALDVLGTAAYGLGRHKGLIGKNRPDWMTPAPPEKPGPPKAPEEPVVDRNIP